MLVPFGDLQQQVLLAAPPPLRVVLYRRLMLRIAERIARRWRAKALITGEVIGQVASQTLENLTAIAEVTSMQVLRPLVGMDKDEISAEAAPHRLPSTSRTFPIRIAVSYLRRASRPRAPDLDDRSFAPKRHRSRRNGRPAAVAAYGWRTSRFPMLESVTCPK